MSWPFPWNFRGVFLPQVMRSLTPKIFFAPDLCNLLPLEKRGEPGVHAHLIKRHARPGFKLLLLWRVYKLKTTHSPNKKLRRNHLVIWSLPLYFFCKKNYLKSEGNIARISSERHWPQPCLAMVYESPRTNYLMYCNTIWYGSSNPTPLHR